MSDLENKFPLIDCSGAIPFMRGTKINVGQILEVILTGHSIAVVIITFPILTGEQINQAIDFVLHELNEFKITKGLKQ